MKKKLFTFLFLLVCTLTTSCTEEVLPSETNLEGTPEIIDLDDKESTDGEEEPDEEVANFPNN